MADLDDEEVLEASRTVSESYREQAERLRGELTAASPTHGWRVGETPEYLSVCCPACGTEFVVAFCPTPEVLFGRVMGGEAGTDCDGLRRLREVSDVMES